MNTVKSMSTHRFSQFMLTSQIVTKLSEFKITPTAKLVLLYLSTCYNPNKSDMFPKQKTIAQKIGVSERSVVRAVSELFKEGLIIIECKYTNRYKFTSRITGERAQNEKNFSTDNLSEEKSQNDIKQYDKMSPHKHEQIRETKKEPEKVEDFRILKEYATKMGAKNTSKYIEALKRNGSAQKIIQEAKTKQWISKRAEVAVNEVKEFIEQSKRDGLTAESFETSEAWLKFGQKIKASRINQEA